MNARPHEPRLARIAAMIADPARSRMLAYLLGGHYATAGELAQVASIVPSTASAHLAKLVDHGLLGCEQRGRHRYFRLADADVAHALEALALIAERDSHDRAWASPERQRLRYARRCYGHLAGVLGVALYDTMVREGHLAQGTSGLQLTEQGSDWLAGLGCKPREASAGSRFAYACVDWSERRDHLAGTLGADLLQHFLSQGWLSGASRAVISAHDGSHRCLRLTPRGREALSPWLGTVLASQR